MIALLAVGKEAPHIETSASDIWMMVFAALIWSLITSFVAWRMGLFLLPKKQETLKPLSWFFVLGAFVLFFVLQLFFFPLLQQLLLYFNPHINTGSIWYQALWQFAAIIGLLIFFVGYTFFLTKEQRTAIWGSFTVSTKIKKGLLGASCWFVCYPLVAMLGNLIALVLLYFGHSLEDITTDQTAVNDLKMLSENPALFAMLAIAVSVAVPIIEELIFRGFLQTWLRGYLGRWGALFTTALIFASFHFSPEQNIANINFILSLFLLGCFLGFVYERFQSLWASIGLHAIFNTISIIFIAFFENGKF